MIAASHGYVDMVRLLLRLGAKTAIGGGLTVAVVAKTQEIRNLIVSVGELQFYR